MTKPYIYLFTNIESDGPVPGLYSMISFASVARSETGEELGEFEANLEPLPEATQHPENMAWWKTEPEWNYRRMCKLVEIQDLEKWEELCEFLNKQDDKGASKKAVPEHLQFLLSSKYSAQRGSVCHSKSQIRAFFDKAWFCNKKYSWKR